MIWILRWTWSDWPGFPNIAVMCPPPPNKIVSHLAFSIHWEGEKGVISRDSNTGHIGYVEADKPQARGADQSIVMKVHKYNMQMFSASCSCRFGLDQQTRLVLCQHLQRAGVLSPLHRSAFISFLPCFALKTLKTVASFACGPYLPPPPQPPPLPRIGMLSVCLFRGKWPFVSAAPRHRRSRRLTPAE